MDQKCPIPTTHKRLSHAHYLWHQALKAYDDPVGFHSNLNATIEALRTVTFMLQNEKKRISKFDEWYASWQEKFKNDPTMKWLRDARTTVVHQADLATASKAYASLHTNLTLLTKTIEIPPMIPTLIACKSLAGTLPEPFSSQRKDLVISVERRWTIPDFADKELLDLLAYAFGVLARIVLEAHQQAGATCHDVDDKGNAVSLRTGRPACMATTKDLRTVRISLEDGSQLIPTHIPTEPNPEHMEIARKRYGAAPLPKASLDPFSFAESLVPTAKAILVKDKYHNRMAWLRVGDGWRMMTLHAADRVEKYVLMRSLAEEVKRFGADALVEVMEGWVYPSNYSPELPPEKIKGRKEILVVSAMTSLGARRTWSTFFSRRFFGGIKLLETVVSDGSIPPYLAPLCEVWGLPIPEGVEPDTRLG